MSSRAGLNQSVCNIDACRLRANGHSGVRQVRARGSRTEVNADVRVIQGSSAVQDRGSADVCRAAGRAASAASLHARLRHQRPRRTGAALHPKSPAAAQGTAPLCVCVCITPDETRESLV